MLRCREEALGVFELLIDSPPQIVVTVWLCDTAGERDIKKFLITVMK